MKLSAKSARLDMYTSLRESFEFVATTPIVHVQGMRCVPHVQHAAVWVILIVGEGGRRGPHADLSEMVQ